jgi:hypothetical protein
MVQATTDERSDSSPQAGSKREGQPFIERRAVGRALNCWDRLRETKELPSRADCLEIFDDDLTNGIIVIEFTPQEEDDLIVECGPLFRDAYGCDPVGLAAKAVLPSATDRGLIFWRVAAEMRKPIADVGEFTNLRGEDVLYRSVFLPISEDGKRITHLMAAFSYKAIH